MHLRRVAGVCALSTGLLIGSPAAAIVLADPGPGGGVNHGSGADRASHSARLDRGSGARLSDSLRNAVHDGTRNAIRGAKDTLSSLAKSSRLPSSSAADDMEFDESDADSIDGSDLGGTDLGADLDTDLDTTTANLATVEPDDGAPPAAETASEPDLPATPAALVSNPVPPIPNVAVPVSNVVTAVVLSVASVPALMESLPTSATPVSDVIASLQAMLTSVTDAGAPLLSVPSDLAALLGAGAQPSVATVGSSVFRVGPSPAIGLSTPAPAGFLPPRPPGFEVALTPELLARPMTAQIVTASGTTTGVVDSSSAVGPAGDGSSVLSIVQNVIGAFVATVSLTALVAIALPGILGLLGTCAAGVRIGYRQAKAGSELPATAVARFVGSGPIGVVRSGSQISLRPRIVRASSRAVRAPRADRPASSSAMLVLDRAV